MDLRRWQRRNLPAAGGGEDSDGDTVATAGGQARAGENDERAPCLRDVLLRCSLGCRRCLPCGSYTRRGTDEKRRKKTPPDADTQAAAAAHRVGG
mmetsp:Transcript_63066/g.159705  ORF Transcript_63066/g.159705 Transcript_63066/m.159705 type:complete len:95 (+) Transcript_63066:2-286(+)